MKRDPGRELESETLGECGRVGPVADVLQERLRRALEHVVCRLPQVAGLCHGLEVGNNRSLLVEEIGGTD